MFFALLLSMGSLFSPFTLLDAHSSTPTRHFTLSSEKRFYLTKCSVIVYKGMRSIRVNRELFIVKEIHSDKKGTYVTKRDLIRLPVKHVQSCKKRTWKCEMCPATFNSRADLYDHIWEVHGHMR